MGGVATGFGTPPHERASDNVTVVRIKRAGTNLSGATTVSFNGTPAVVTTDTRTKITTKVPGGGATGPVSVTTATGGTVTTTKSFKVT